MLPTWIVFCYLPPSADSAFMIYQHLISQRTLTNGKQDVLKQQEANTDLLYFSALSYYKCSVADNKSARNQPKSCVPAMQNHTNHYDARPILFQLKSLLPFSLFLFV